MSMNSVILRGYERYDRIITRGYGSGWIGKRRAEILRFISKFTRSMRFTSKRTGVINGT